jgi:hypothetical protein
MANIKEIADRIVLLQELTATSGTITKRVQGRILQELSDEDLLAVAREFAQRRKLSAILSGAVSNDNRQ